ncbi:hypothetical protein [Iodidimonas sp. SYSU 1G8]|uniref:hypothetical protein n=1 Tax=Iodidimonas sp. SYSU 1G8 TaxID=3133967 RepID=UPI0031FF0BA4
MNDVEDDRHSGPVLRIVLTAVGLVQGLGLFLLFEDVWAARTALLMGLTTLCLLGPSTFQLTYGLGPLRRAVTASAVLALPMALLACWYDWRIDWGGETRFTDHRAVFFTALPVIAYIVWAYLQTWVEGGRLRFAYASLFRFAWSNILIAAIAAAFLGAFWLVLLLWGALFHLVGIDFFKDLFQESIFAWLFSGAVFGLGIAVARENGKLVPVLRRVALMLFQILAPVLAAAALLFLAVLPVTGLEPLWATRSATLVLVSLLFALALFANAVIQDGDRLLPFGRWMNWLMGASLVAMPVFAGIAFYAVRLRIDQYGLTPERFIGQFIVIAASVLSLAYAASVLLRWRDWTGCITRVNPWIAPLVAVMAALLFTPLADPYGRSAYAQVERLAAGEVTVEAFDYGLLKFKTGRPGRYALDNVRLMQGGHPQGDVIAARIAAVDEAKHYWEVRLDPSMIPANDLIGLRAKLVVRPAGTEVPDEVIAAMNDSRDWALRECLQDSQRCGILVTDLNRDGTPEFVFLSMMTATVIGSTQDASESAPEGPRISGMMIYRSSDGWATADSSYIPASDTLWNAFLAGDIELVEPAYYDIRIGKNRLHY